MKPFRSLVILMGILCLLLTGCSSDDIEPPVGDEIALSGNVGYYGTMDPAERKELLQKYISVTGTVFSSGHTTFYIGDTAIDGISVSCTFTQHSKELAQIRTGDQVTVQGVCTAAIGNYLYLDHCQLSGIDITVPSSTAPNTATQPSTAHTVTTPPTTAPSTPPPTTPPATAPTAPAPTTPPATAPTAPAPTTPPATAPTAAPSTPAETTPTTGGIQFIKWPEVISRNEIAEVTIQGKPNTKYSITVYYSSGPSKAKGLEDKTSDSNGLVTWTWKVGGKTAAGTFRIVVSGGGEQQTVNFTVKAE